MNKIKRNNKESNEIKNVFCRQKSDVFGKE